MDNSTQDLENQSKFRGDKAHSAGKAGMEKYKRYGLYLMCASSVLVAAASIRFIFLGLAEAAPGLAVHEGARVFSFYMHVAGATVALLIGPFQFIAAIRNRFPTLHRLIGTVYVCSCLVGGLSGIYIGFYSPHGPVAATGFMVLGVIWVVFTSLGLGHILVGKVTQHRRWMMRSFALTFAAVTLRLFLPPMFGAGMDPALIFSILAWASWIPNLIIVEKYMIRPMRFA